MILVHIQMDALIALSTQNWIEKSFTSIECLAMRSHTLKRSSPGWEDGSAAKEFIKQGG